MKILQCLFCIVFCLSSLSLYSQAISEGMSPFESEIERLILNNERNQYKKIIVTLHPYQLTSDDWKEKVKYSIINDSVIKQRLGRSSYFGLVSNGEIIPVDFNVITHQITNRERNETDSLNYIVSTTTSANVVDTSTFHRIKLLDTSGAITKLIVKRYNTNSQKPNSIYELEYIGDSICQSKFYKAIDTTWILVHENTKTFRNKDTYIEETEITWSIGNDNEIINNTLIAKWYYTYDESNRLTQIYKEEYALTSTEIMDKHLMTIKYINK